MLYFSCPSVKITSINEKLKWVKTNENYAFVRNYLRIKQQTRSVAERSEARVDVLKTLSFTHNAFKLYHMFVKLVAA